MSRSTVSTTSLTGNLEFKDYQFAKTEMENKQNYLLQLKFENELNKHKEDGMIKIKELRDKYEENMEKIVSLNTKFD